MLDTRNRHRIVTIFVRKTKGKVLKAKKRLRRSQWSVTIYDLMILDTWIQNYAKEFL